MADLVSLDYVKGYLGITGVKDDAVLSSLITSESGRFEGLAGGAILNQTITGETWSGDGGTVYFPMLSPVVSVTALTIDDAGVSKRTTTSGDGWVLERGAVRLVGYRFTKGVSNCSLDYVAGYGATSPSDVQQAVAEMVATKYRGKDRSGVSSASLAGESVSYLTDLLSEAVQQVVAKYQRVRV